MIKKILGFSLFFFFVFVFFSSEAFSQKSDVVSKFDPTQNDRLDRLEAYRKSITKRRAARAVEVVDKTARATNKTHDGQISDLNKSNEEIRNELFGDGKTKPSLSDRITGESEIREKADKALNEGINELNNKSENASIWHTGLLIGLIVAGVIAIIALILGILTAFGWFGWIKIKVNNGGNGTVVETPGTQAVPVVPANTPPASETNSVLGLDECSTAAGNINNQNVNITVIGDVPEPASRTKQLRPAVVTPPPPTIVEVSNSIPINMASVEGGREFVLRGTGLMSGTQVFVDGNEATKVSFVDVFHLIFVAPAANDGTVGFVDIRVVNPDGQESVLPDAIRYF